MNDQKNIKEKEMKMKRFTRNYNVFIILFFLIITIFTIYCTERMHTNPLDPKYEGPDIHNLVKGKVDPALKDKFDFSKLKIISPIEEAQIDKDGNFSIRYSVDTTNSLYHAVLPITMDNKTILLSYAFSNNNVNPLGNSHNTGASSTALAIVMMNPLFWGSNSDIRADIAQKVVNDNLFSSLVSEVATAISNDPINYLDSTTTCLHLYKSACQIALNVFKQYESGGLNKMYDSKNVKLDRPDPYIEGGNGAKVTFINPFYIYYGTGIYNYSDSKAVDVFLQNPRPLKFGFIPYIGKFGETEQSLNNGSYTIKIFSGFNFNTVGFANTIDPNHPSGLATLSNLASGILKLISIFCTIPGFEDKIPELILEMKNELDIIDLVKLYGEGSDVEQIISKTVIFIGKNADKIVKVLWISVNSPETFSDYLKNFEPILKNIAIPFKILNTSTKLFFFIDMIELAPRNVQFDIELSNGIITPIKKNTPPTAAFTVSPNFGPQSTIFRFDANSCSDQEDPTPALQVRWDWENDGIWDTNYSTNKIADHQYSSEGTKIIKMEVKDTGGLTDLTTRQISVTRENTPPTAYFTVTPISGTTSTIFSFDASSSSDQEDPTPALQVRWDWENDGVWDTEYSMNKIASYQYSKEGTKIIRMEVKDTGGLTNLTTRQIDVINYPPQENKIVFTCVEYGSNYQNIYAMNSDGSNVMRLTSDIYFNHSPAWSPDKKKIAFTSESSSGYNKIIRVMNADGSNIIKLINDVSPYWWQDYEPAWSPDGTKILFTSIRHDKSLPDIYMMNSDGTNQINLTNSPWEDCQPSWSPDGTKIIFISSRVAGFYQRKLIYMMNTDGSDQTLVTADLSDNNLSPKWSPDGQKIAFVSQNDMSNYSKIFIMNIDGSNRTCIKEYHATINCITWSPDGKKIAFDINNYYYEYPYYYYSTNEIRTINTNGTDEIQLSKDKVFHYQPSWGIH